jgi:cytochrome P450
MIEQPAHDQGERIPTGAELTALDPTFRTDPHPVLARLRRDAPAHYDGVINRWVLTRHDDVERVSRPHDVARSHKANEGTYMRCSCRHAQSGGPPFSDPPDHTRLRALVNGRSRARSAPAPRTGSSRLLDPVAGAGGRSY